MNTQYIICLLFALPNLASAQSDLVTQLADQVCSCMETNDRKASPAEQAQECVRLVSLRRKRELFEKLSINPENPVELNQLSERMADQLSQNCPTLTTLRFDDFEREIRWSDRNTVRSASNEVFRYRFPKNPAADPPETTVSEPPALWRVAGTVAGRPRRGELRLRLPDSRVHHFELPSSVGRRLGLAEGQRVTVVYDRQWRKSENGGIVALVVRAIE